MAANFEVTTCRLHIEQLHHHDALNNLEARPQDDRQREPLMKDTTQNRMEFCPPKGPPINNSTFLFSFRFRGAVTTAGRLRGVFLTLRLSAWPATSNRQVRTSHMPRSLTTRSGGHVMTNTYNGRMSQVDRSSVVAIWTIVSSLLHSSLRVVVLLLFPRKL